MTRTNDELRIFDDSPGVASDALTSDLAGLDRVRFVLAWRPAQASPLYIKYVKIGDLDVLPAQGAQDTESPFPLELGAFVIGRVIELSWELRVFNDLVGVAAFAKARRADQWTSLERSGPLGVGAVWKASARFTV